MTYEHNYTVTSNLETRLSLEAWKTVLVDFTIFVWAKGDKFSGASTAAECYGASLTT